MSSKRHTFHVSDELLTANVDDKDKLPQAPARMPVYVNPGPPRFPDGAEPVELEPDQDKAKPAEEDATADRLAPSEPLTLAKALAQPRVNTQHMQHPPAPVIKKP